MFSGLHTCYHFESKIGHLGYLSRSKIQFICLSALNWFPLAVITFILEWVLALYPEDNLLRVACVVARVQALFLSLSLTVLDLIELNIQ